MADGPEITFGALPGRTGGGRNSKWAEVLDYLVANADQFLKVDANGDPIWAFMGRYDTAPQAGSAAGHLRHDAPKPEGYWEFSARGTDLYGRYFAQAPEGSENGSKARKTKAASTA